ncbi:hypothetical protein [Streptomyces sp. NPDC002566]|uniref:hypothetical protein n=1 Tax=Streptomyces sp. NPDC002566 TaxID=3364650 RepID=UPI0036930D98
MQPQDVVPRPVSGSVADRVVDVEQAEAALVEHYPRLVRIAYLVLSPDLGRGRRVLTAHALAQRALPRPGAPAPVIPAQSTARDGDAGYGYVRLRVLRSALEATLPLRQRARRSRHALVPPVLPMVWGLRLFPRSGGAEELALDQSLASLSAPARAAYVLRGLERLDDAEVRRALTEAGVDDVDAALEAAGAVPARYSLLESPEFDPCSLQARPTDLMRRRRHTRAALAAAAALAVCGALFALPDRDWGPDGAAAPPYARNPAAEAALDPGRLVRVSPVAWKTATRADFSVWPARGELTGDDALLRRALAVWARPGDAVRVSATPGTPAGGPSGPPQLLYAGDVGVARVVILYDGLRIARYAEPENGTAGAVLDLARADGALGPEAGAVVLDRADGNVRYLAAPWVRQAAERDLSKPGAGLMNLTLTRGVTSPLASPATRAGACTTWNVLQLSDASGSYLLSDLGEILPARITAGRPAAPKDATGAEALRAWAPFACSLGEVRAQGVRSVNAWAYARQPLPDGSGSGGWVCTRAETWRGDGTRALAQFRTPGGLFGAVVAAAGDVPACGPRDPHVLAGVLWKSEAGSWYLLAAGDRAAESVRATGGVRGESAGNLLAVRTKRGARADLEGTLKGGRSVSGLR